MATRVGGRWSDGRLARRMRKSLVGKHASAVDNSYYWAPAIRDADTCEGDMFLQKANRGHSGRNCLADFRLALKLSDRFLPNGRRRGAENANPGEIAIGRLAKSREVDLRWLRAGWRRRRTVWAFVGITRGWGGLRDPRTLFMRIRMLAPRRPGCRRMGRAAERLRDGNQAERLPTDTPEIRIWPS